MLSFSLHILVHNKGSSDAFGHREVKKVGHIIFRIPSFLFFHFSSLYRSFFVLSLSKRKHCFNIRGSNLAHPKNVNNKS